MIVKDEDGLTIDTEKLLNDIHALMWMGDGCRICAHCVLIHREPYYKARCALTECVPLWRGLKDSLEVQE
jgi:hypothetical protein